MTISTYDSYLLIILKSPFGITGMQTDDTLILCTPEFSAIKEKKIQKGCVPRETKGSTGRKLPNGV
jgi:hypothetical protein